MSTENEDARRLAEALKEGFITTEHKRVFYRDRNSIYKRGELDFAQEIANKFPDYVVIITMGPWRMYTVRYKINYIKKTIELDFYSPGYPYSPYLQDITNDIAEDIRKLIETYGE
jgi:hypothetical protein